jgi:hypothetical protein
VSSTLWVVLFDVDGTTPLKQLGYATGVRWLDELDAEGSFSFSVPVEEAGDLAVGSVVKFALGDYSIEYVFAGVVETVKLEKAGATTGGVSRVYDVSGRGLRARLDDAVVYPSGGDTTRTFTSVSAGSILRTLVLEAQARGALSGFTLSFSASTDSNGDAYTDTLSIEEQVGATLGQVADNLQELICDIWVDPDLTVNLVNERGDDLTTGVDPVTLRVGGSVSELSEELAGPIRNTVLIASGTNGATFTTRTNAGSISTYGRRETFVSLANTSDAAVVTLAGDQVLNTSATPADGVTVQLDPTGPQAYLDFTIGDLIYLVDGTGTKTSYRVRSLTVTQDDAGLLSFVPELGTARADLDKRLKRALDRIERGNAGGDTDLGFAPEPVGGGSEFEVCTVTSYDPSTREGSADCSGTPTDFENGSIWDFYPGDDILLGETVDGRTIATGLVDAGGGGTGTSFTFVPPSGVPGLPYDPNVSFTLWQAGEGFVTYSSGASVIDFVTPTVYTLPIPSPFTNGLALSRQPTGTFVFQSGTDTASPPTSNGLLVRYNGVNNLYNYGGVRTLGVSQGVAYCSCTHKNGVVNARIITVSSTGVVSDFLPTVQDDLGVLVPYVGPDAQPSASGSWWIAGEWGVAWAPFTGASTRYIYTLANGSTAARRWSTSLTTNFLYGSASGQRWERLTMNSTHVIAADRTIGDRSWRRMNLATGVIENFTDVLPVGSTIEEVAAGGNDDAILISGTYDNGGGPVPAYFTTSGTGVTTTTLADTSGFINVRRDFTGNILGKRIVTSTSDQLVIGVSLT